MSSPLTAVTGGPLAFAARIFNSNFAQASLTYHALSIASDGCVYYALTSDTFDQGARMFRYDPLADKITVLAADLTAVVGEKNSVAQGKVHVNFHELNGKLYFATHLGFYNTLGNGRELQGAPPNGVAPYPGGHFLSCDLKSGAFQDLGKPVPGDGIIAIALDSARGLLYGLMWPHGELVRYDLATGQVYNFGKTSLDGEAGIGARYRNLCRSLAIDLPSGSLYLTTSDGSIVCASGNSLSTLPVSLRRDSLGVIDFTVAGEGGYNWRQTVVPGDGWIYGVHGATGTGLRLNPASQTLEFLPRFISDSTRRCGVRDLKHKGYLGFKLAPSGKTIFYLTGSHINDTEAAFDVENVNLLTIELDPAVACRDHGSVGFLTGGQPFNINSIAIAADGTVYAISGLMDRGTTDLTRKRYDLISFPSGLKP